ncbi:MAG: hypothetical protein KJ062_16200 [Thermoanaerobaculia bacterium]|nr:hypothetical protein [Thermoanaerobaculia bacterium]
MKRTLLALLLVAALPMAAEEITVEKVLSAHAFGAPVESILARINDPANTVPPIPSADVEKLRAAMVPEPVVSALLAKAPPVAPAGTAHQPDNPKAMDLVKAVQAGTSEKLIVDQIMQNGVVQRPSLNDLIYFKENKVPEGIIRALMEAPLVAAGTAPGSKAAPAIPTQIEVDDLVRKTGLFAKSRPGKLVLTAEKIEWIDGRNQNDSFEMFPAGLKAVHADCLARPDGKFCYEVELEMAKGGNFSFVDGKSDVGGNESIKALLEAVKTFYPKLPIVEKVK